MTTSTVAPAAAEDKPKLTGRGGPGRGGGRPKGAKSRSTNELEKAMNELLDKKIAKSEGQGIAITALDLLQELYKSKRTPFIVRNAAMKAALPYEAAKLQPKEPVEYPNKPKEQSFEYRMSDARDSLKRKLVKVIPTEASQQLAGQSN